MLNESLGEDEGFHQQFGYYADIIRPVVTEKFPDGWEERLISLEGVPKVFCLEPHDMAAAKCQAGREKDLELLSYLFKEELLDADLVKERLYQVPAMRESMIVKSHQALVRAVERAKQK